jgi:hypothetical protein
MASLIYEDKTKTLPVTDRSPQVLLPYQSLFLT